MPISKSSKQWLREHHKDVFVKKAKKDGLRARSVYKLQEIQERYAFIKPGMVVIDIGAAPGSWSEFVVSAVGKTGLVIAIDILPMKPIFGVDFIQGDFGCQETQLRLLKSIPSGKDVDLIISDMAPNMSGIPVVDQANIINLASLALAFARQMLNRNGSLLIKLFHGDGFTEFVKELHTCFRNVRVIKPKASRSRSKEVFLLASCKLD